MVTSSIPPEFVHRTLVNPSKRGMSIICELSFTTAGSVTLIVGGEGVMVNLRRQMLANATATAIKHRRKALKKEIKNFETTFDGAERVDVDTLFKKGSDGASREKLKRLLIATFVLGINSGQAFKLDSIPHELTDIAGDPALERLREKYNRLRPKVTNKDHSDFKSFESLQKKFIDAKASFNAGLTKITKSLTADLIGEEHRVLQALMTYFDSQFENVEKKTRKARDAKQDAARKQAKLDTYMLGLDWNEWTALAEEGLAELDIPTIEFK